MGGLQFVYLWVHDTTTRVAARESEGQSRPVVTGVFECRAGRFALLREDELRSTLPFVPTALSHFRGPWTMR